MRRVISMLIAVFGVVSVVNTAHADPGRRAVEPKPKLVVVISIDQFGADLFNSFRSQYKAGLHRLTSGIVYPNAYHKHGVTETCAGHAVIASGRNPAKTGIIANEWYDNELARDRYCTDDGVHVAASDRRSAGVGPGLLETSTIGDWLKSASVASRVFSIAGKDRSAIMMGGHSPNAAFWFDGKQGFDTWGNSAADAQLRLAPLVSFNAKLAARIKAKRPDWTYLDMTCRAREQEILLGGGRVLHAHLPPDRAAPYPGAPAATEQPLPPWFYDSVTLDAAFSLIKSEKLGQGEAPDLLAIGLSGTDFVGHAYGTQGPEMCDQQARLDAELGRFLKEVESIKVPVLIVVTADHGGADIPERLAERGYAGERRINPMQIVNQINKTLRAVTGVDWDPVRPAFFDTTRLSVVDRNGHTLGDEALRQRIADAAVVAAGKLPGVAGAWTATALKSRHIDADMPPDLMPLADRMALSYYAGRSGDVMIAFDSYTTAAPMLPGRLMMVHSSPYDYDRRVPILFWRSGMVTQERTLPVAVVDIAPTLAAEFGIQPPDDVDGHCLEIGGAELICGQI